MKSRDSRGIVFTSPIGRGRRAAPGEGLGFIDKPYPLTPTLSPREREHTAVVAVLIVGSCRGDVR